MLRMRVSVPSKTVSLRGSLNLRANAGHEGVRPCSRVHPQLERAFCLVGRQHLAPSTEDSA